MVTARDLAHKYGVSERKIRRILRTEGVKKKGYYWQWNPETKTYTKVVALISRKL